MADGTPTEKTATTATLSGTHTSKQTYTFGVTKMPSSAHPLMQKLLRLKLPIRFEKPDSGHAVKPKSTFTHLKTNTANWLNVS
jgi:hypothetical protein